MSAFVPPMKATSGSLPHGEGWVAEIKWDGMRLQAELVATADAPLTLRLRSGSGRDITSSFPELAGLADAVGTSAVLDGEAVVFDDGTPSFSRLQQRIHVAEPTHALVEGHPVVYLIFDLLALDGHDVTSLPYRQRRSLLDRLVDESPAWRVPPYAHGNGADLLAIADARDLEGVVVKRIDSPYVSGRSDQWVKVKIRRRQEFVVGGWLQGTNSLANTIGSLVVGVHDDDGVLRCAGAVGSGLRDADRRALLERFSPTEDCPFEGDLPAFDKTLHWVEPTVVVEVEYGRWPEGGVLWHPAFCGRRIDRDPADVTRETIAPGDADASPPGPVSSTIDPPDPGPDVE